MRVTLTSGDLKEEQSTDIEMKRMMIISLHTFHPISLREIKTPTIRIIRDSRKHSLADKEEDSRHLVGKEYVSEETECVNILLSV